MCFPVKPVRNVCAHALVYLFSKLVQLSVFSSELSTHAADAVI